MVLNREADNKYQKLVNAIYDYILDPEVDTREAVNDIKNIALSLDRNLDM